MEDGDNFGDNNLISLYQTCPEISATQVRDPSQPDSTVTEGILDMYPESGIMCRDGNQTNGQCVDYEVRFCCEGCCPMLNVSGNPELTDYYENYPGIYELQDDMFNDHITYKQIAGVDEAGNTIYGEGVIYYWEDVGWLLAQGSKNI